MIRQIHQSKYYLHPFIAVTKLMLLSLLVFSLSSCSKSSDPAPDTEEPEQTSGTVPFYKVQRVENFAAPTDDANPTAPAATVFFSLENKETAPANFAQTARWDIAFGGLYNSFMSANNGKATNNYGTGGPGTGAIMIVEKPFDEVTDIPAEGLFKTGKDLIGTDSSGDFGEGIGWYLYDFGGKIRGDGSYSKEHVAYAMPEKRTVIVRTANGNFAKVKMISCYKDAFTADLWFRETPHMYFTFEYVLAPKGSTKFEIK